MSDSNDHVLPYPRLLRVPFVFVPDGAPPPLEWMAAHPGFVTFAARFVPRPERSSPPEPVLGPEPASPGWIGDPGAPDGPPDSRGDHARRGR